MMTLDVLIITHLPEGIDKIEEMRLPEVKGVNYIVSWQDHRNASIPASLSQRSDIAIYRFDKTGVSHNRNNAIAHSTADIYLIADNDLKYTSEQLYRVIYAFVERPEVDYASFMYDGNDAKTYPSETLDISKKLPKSFFQTTFEIAVRRSKRTTALRFNDDFGPGAKYFSVGEDEIFLLTARKMGLNCRFFPIVITRHEGLTTGLRRMTDPKALAGTGAVISLLYPRTFLLRIPLKAWRMWRGGQASFFKALGHGLRGAWIAKTKIKLS